jgi:O-antigen ligase
VAILQKTGREGLLWGLALLAALGTALGIVRPAWGVSGVVLLVALLGVVLVIQKPERGLTFCLLAAPWYMAFRGFVILQLPTALFGVRFWAELVLGASAAGLLLRGALHPQTRLKLRPDDAPVLLYLTMCSYGMVLSLLTQHPLYSVYGFHFVLFPALFYLLVRWLKPSLESGWGLVRAFLTGWWVFALVSFWVVATGPELVLRWNHAVRQQLYTLAVSRGGSTAGDPMTFWRFYPRMQSLLFEENVWGALCAMVSLIALGMLLVRRRPWMWGTLFAVATLGLLLSVARGALVGWGVGIVVLALGRQRFSGRLWGVLCVLSVLTGGALLYLAENPRIAYFVQMADRAANGISRGDFDERTHQWEKGWDILQRNPSGTGIGTVGYSASSTGMSQSIVADGNYISLGAELGWPGLLMFAVTLLSLLWVLIRHQRAIQDARLRGLGLGLLAALCGMMVHAVTANVFEYHYTFPVFWTLLGIYVTGCERDHAPG